MSGAAVRTPEAPPSSNTGVRDTGTVRRIEREALTVPRASRAGVTRGPEWRVRRAALADRGNAASLARVERARLGALSALVDWVSFTVQGVGEEPDLGLLLPGLEGQKWTEAKHGRSGYRRCVTLGNISVCFDGGPGMGHWVSLSGSGCREYEAALAGDTDRAEFADWSALFSYWTNLGASFTRVDLAFDDRAGLLDVDRAQEYVESGRITSVWRRYRVHRGGEMGQPTHGKTLYFGHQSSDSQLRLYDKLAECQCKGFHMAGVWNRAELQLRDGAASRAVKLLIAEGLGGVVGLLRGFAEFRERDDDDQNKSRWPVAGWWLTFLGAAARLKLEVMPKSYSIRRVVEWVERQVAPSLALLYKWTGDLGPLWSLTESGLGRLGPKHAAMLAAEGVAA